MYGSNPTGGGGGGGTGDVVGPESSADNALAAFDGVTGKLIKATDITYTAGESQLIGTLGSWGAEAASSNASYRIVIDADSSGTDATFTVESNNGTVLMTADEAGNFSWGTAETTGKYTFQGNGTTTGKTIAGRNSSGTNTWYIQDNGLMFGSSGVIGGVTFGVSNNISTVAYIEFNTTTARIWPGAFTSELYIGDVSGNYGAFGTGGFRTAQVTKTADYTATRYDYAIWADCTAGNVIITLPTAATTSAGRIYVVTRIDGSGNTVSVASTGGQTFNGAASPYAGLSAQWKSATFQSDGSNWIIISTT